MLAFPQIIMDDPVTSYAAQVDYYTNYLKGKDAWEFVGIYTDEGISATKTRHYDVFKRNGQSGHGWENRPHRHEIGQPLC